MLKNKVISIWNNNLIAKNLRKLMEANNVSEKDISDALDISQMTIRRVVSGETEDPRISTLNLIANYFNVSVDSLLKDNDDKPIHIIENNTPIFVPILDWDTALSFDNSSNFNSASHKEWHPLIVKENIQINEKSFALESKPSLKERFPLGTLFILTPEITPIDGDLILIKIKSTNQLTIRELIMDPPRWQLNPIVTGSDVIFYDSNLHYIVGIIVISLLHYKK